MASHIPPNLANKPALVRALIALLIEQPQRQIIYIEAAGQDFTREACLVSVRTALHAYADQDVDLKENHSKLEPATYENELEELEDAWFIVNEYISSKSPERNLPTREQLEHWMHEKELRRLEQLAVRADKDSSWRLENLSVEQMQELFYRARAWNEANLGIAQTTQNHFVSSLSPQQQTLALKSRALHVLTDTHSQQTLKRAVADIESGGTLDPNGVAWALNQPSHSASATTNFVTTQKAHTQSLANVAASPEAQNLDQSLRAATNFDLNQTAQVRQQFETKVLRGQAPAQALKQTLQGIGKTPQEAERIVAATLSSVNTYGELVNDIGGTQEQLAAALKTHQSQARAASPTARQLTDELRLATQVSSKQADNARGLFEAGISRGLTESQALDEALNSLPLSPTRRQTAKATLAPALTRYQDLSRQRQTQAAASQLTQEIQAASGLTQEEAIEAFTSLDHKLATDQPHKIALVEVLAEQKLAPEQIKKVEIQVGETVENYAIVSQDLRVQPLSKSTSQSINERFVQKVQAATGLERSQAIEARNQFEARVIEGANADEALEKVLTEDLHLSSDNAQAAQKTLRPSANLYEAFVRADKTETAVAKAAPIAQQQFTQRLMEIDVHPALAARATRQFEQAVRLGQPTQVALTTSLNELGLPPNQIDQLTKSLTPFAHEYAQLVQVSPSSHSGLHPTSTTKIPLATLRALNERSFGSEDKVITHTALGLYQAGSTPDNFEPLLAESVPGQEINPAVIQQTREALQWLHQNQAILQELGISTDIPATNQLIFEMDARPWNSAEIFTRQLDLINQQLITKNAQGITGWVKAPRLKWQATWTKFAAKHPKFAGFAGFLSAPKKFITKKVGAKLMSVGAKWALKKGLKKLIGKGIVALGSNILPGIGQVLSVLMLVDMLHDLAEQVPILRETPVIKGLSFLKRNWKKLLAGLGALLAVFMAFLAKMAAVLPAVLTGLGLWLTPAIPIIGIPMLIGGLIGLARQFGAWAGKGALNAINSLGSTIGDFLGLSTTATVPAYIVAAPFVAVAGLAAVNIFSTMALTTAFVLPPTEAQAPGLTQDPGNVVEFSCDHPACQIADIVQAYAGGVLTQNTWTVAVDNLLRDNFSEATVSELERSVNSFYYLQCVGFKVAAEKELGIDLPHQNAVAFMYNHPGCSAISKDQAQYGDNAIWGPQSGCPTQDPNEANSLCSSNSACCGHIGVVTKTKGNQKVFVTSANASGNGSVDTREFTRYNVDKFIRCQ